MTWEITREGINGTQKLGNLAAKTSYAIQDIGRLRLIKGVTTEAAGKMLAGASLLITLNNVRTNGLNWDNGTDTVFEGAAFIPGVGWIISGAYFIANYIVKGVTGESIGEHIRDVVNKPQVQAGIAIWKAIP